MTRRDLKNKSQYWVSSRIDGLHFLHADFTEHDYPPHMHEAYVIAVTEAGGAHFSDGHISDGFHPSALFVTNPGDCQSARMGDHDRWRYRSFYLSPAAAERIAGNLGAKRAPRFSGVMFKDSDLITRFRHLHRTFETEQDGLLLDELLINTFSTLFARHARDGLRRENTSRDQALANRIVEMMHDRYDESLGLEELAAVADLTCFQLIGLFKRTIGMTPHSYLIQLRLNAACRLLRRGQSLAESAATAGFYDQSAMNKHFKRCYGITPLQFAQASRGN